MIESETEPAGGDDTDDDEFDRLREVMERDAKAWWRAQRSVVRLLLKVTRDGAARPRRSTCKQCAQQLCCPQCTQSAASAAGVAEAPPGAEDCEHAPRPAAGPACSFPDTDSRHEEEPHREPSAGSPMKA